MSFRVKRTIQTTVELIVDHEEDAVAVAMSPLTEFMKAVLGTTDLYGFGKNIRERGTPSITPTTERSEEGQTTK